MKSINCKALKELLDQKKIELIDVREPYETSCANIGGHLIPMDEIKNNINQFNPNKAYVIMCRSGKRASAVANFLEIEFRFSNVGVLEGGFEAYVETVDNSLELC